MNVEVNHPNLSVNFGAERVYPELEDLEVTPTIEEQNFKSSKYGFNNVKVKRIEAEELTITPTEEEQVFTGLFDKVTCEKADIQGDIELPFEFNVSNVGKYVEITVSGNNTVFMKNEKTAVISVVEENKVSVEEKDISYQQLDYIEFTGTQFINTNIPLFNYNKFRIDLEITTDLTRDSVILGTVNGSTSYESWYDVYGATVIKYNGTEVKASSAITKGTKVKLRFEKSGTTVKVYVNGTQKTSKTVTTSLFNSPLYLFKRTGNSNLGLAKLHSAKIYCDSVLVANYTPVKTNRPCLYDSETNTYLYNAGTGEFLYG